MWGLNDETLSRALFCPTKFMPVYRDVLYCTRITELSLNLHSAGIQELDVPLLGCIRLMELQRFTCTLVCQYTRAYYGSPRISHIARITKLYMYLHFGSVQELIVVLPGVFAMPEIQSFNCTCVLPGFKSLLWLYQDFSRRQNYIALHVPRFLPASYWDSRSLLAFQ